MRRRAGAGDRLGPVFSNIGWGEILVCVVIAAIVIGPERLPELVKNVQAAVHAARGAIRNARAELDGSLGEEFDELRKPIAEVARWQRMGPRAALTQALFEGDESALDDFDPRRIMAGDTAGEAYRAKNRQARRSGSEERTPSPMKGAGPRAAEARRADSDAGVAARPGRENSAAGEAPAAQARGAQQGRARLALGGGGVDWDAIW